MLTVDVLHPLGNLTLEVKVTLPGRGVTVIFGVSGAGKTSLLNIISGLTHPQQGKVVNNQQILVDTEQRIALPVERRRIGYLFQDARLFPHYRVRGNLAYGMADSMRPQFDHIVELLGIGGLLNRFPRHLSGGEKQRVAIGRTLLSGPELLLMDEPLASLDLPRKRELLPYLERMAQQVDIPILYVTHSLDEVLRLAENILLLEQGKVSAFGRLEDLWGTEVLHPWLNSQGEPVNVLKVEVVKHSPDYPISILSLANQPLWVEKVEKNPGDTLRISINASDIILSLTAQPCLVTANVLLVTVAMLQEADQHILVQLNLEGGSLWAKISRLSRDQLQIAVGMSLYAQISRITLIC